jgi:hypothetical protein
MLHNDVNQSLFSSDHGTQHNLQAHRGAILHLQVSNVAFQLQSLQPRWYAGTASMDQCMHAGWLQRTCCTARNCNDINMALEWRQLLLDPMALLPAHAEPTAEAAPGPKGGSVTLELHCMDQAPGPSF